MERPADSQRTVLAWARRGGAENAARKASRERVTVHWLSRSI
jgi:hypothetical protein